MNPKSMFGCGRIFKNKLLLVQKKCSLHGNVNGVQIPARIEREPTDVLKVLVLLVPDKWNGSQTFPRLELSKAVSEKSINLNYRAQYGILFHNTDVFTNKIIGLTMESGRKAAKWVVSQNPKFFQYKVAEPYIESFAAPKILDEESELSEETLINAIQMIHVEYAIDVYNLLKKKGVDVSATTKQHLLELVCYYNCSNKPDVSFVTLQFHADRNIEEPNTWKDNGFHMNLFYEMVHNAESYSAVILGMYKYGNFIGSYNLYNKAEKNGIKFGVDVYNAILLELFKKADTFYDGEVTILKMLKKMEKLKIKPNLETLNKTLCCISQMRKYFKSRFFAVKVINEFRRIGIKPSLTTYYYLLNVLIPRKEFFKPTKLIKKLFSEILKEIEDEIPEFGSETDYKFFPKAMEVAFQLSDLKKAERIDKLLNTGNNKVFLNSYKSEVAYYHSFVKVIFKCGNIKEIPVLMDRVYCTWPLDITTYANIIEILTEKIDGGKYLKLVWFYLKPFQRKALWSLLDGFLRVLDEKGHQLNDNADHEIAKEVWKMLGSNFEKSLKIQGRSRLLGIFSRKGDKELACEVFDFSFKNPDELVHLDFPSLKEFLNLCSTCGDNARAMKCIEYSYRIELDATELINIVKSNFKLDENDLKTLDGLKKSCIKNPDNEFVI